MWVPLASTIFFKHLNNLVANNRPRITKSRVNRPDGAVCLPPSNPLLSIPQD